MTGLAVIGAPSSMGAYAPGQELAPAALREAGLLRALAASGLAVDDRGDLPRARWAPDREQPRAQNAAAVAATIGAVENEVRAALGGGVERVLVLGGDCTTGLGAVQALREDGGRHGVVYLDLHADMNVPDSVVDGALDWMGLGHALGLDGAVPEVAACCALEPGQVSLLGFDPGQATVWERKQVEATGVAVTGVDALRADPYAAARAAVDALGDADRLAVHFDVDVIDFVDAPLSENTGRNVGVALETALGALEVLLADPRVRTLAITELNPLHGAEDGSTLKRFASGLANAAARAW